MGNRIVDAYTDEDAGMSRVAIQNKYGIFHGYSFCAPEDMENFSAYAGERYAEIRATAEFAKFKLKQEKVKLWTIENLIKDIFSFCPIEEEDTEIMHRIRLKLRDYKQSVDDYNNLYQYLRNSVTRQDEERAKILSRAK